MSQLNVDNIRNRTGANGGPTFPQGITVSAGATATISGDLKVDGTQTIVNHILLVIRILVLHLLLQKVMMLLLMVLVLPFIAVVEIKLLLGIIVIRGYKLALT